MVSFKLLLRHLYIRTNLLKYSVQIINFFVSFPLAGVKIARLNKNRNGPSQDEYDGFGTLRMWTPECTTPNPRSQQAPSSHSDETSPDRQIDDHHSEVSISDNSHPTQEYRGGLLTSRAIGGAQPGLVAYPSLCHVEVSRKRPARLLLVSRGVWESWPNKSMGKDKFEGKRMVKYSRRRNLELATVNLVKRTVSY